MTTTTTLFISLFPYDRDIPDINMNLDDLFLDETTCESVHYLCDQDNGDSDMTNFVKIFTL